MSPPSTDGPSTDTLALLRRWAVLLDSTFRIPGTGIRFGLDAILGLVPGLGDLASPIFTGLLLVTGFRMRLPAIVQARMVLNAAVDMVVGLVPVLGDLFDIGWKANLRNMALLERYARPGVAPSAGDYAFVFVSLAIVALIAVVPVLALIWIFSNVPLV